MGTAFAIVILLVFFSRLETTESKSMPFKNKNSKEKQVEGLPAEDECDVRRLDGSCHNQWRVGKKEYNGKNLLETRQATCDRTESPNCRIMIGKKRCIRSDGRRSLLCTPRNRKRSIPNSHQIYIYKPAVKRNLKTMQKKCDLQSPLCRNPFPGKRKGNQGWTKRGDSDENLSNQAGYQQDQDSVTVALNDLLSAKLLTRGMIGLPYDLDGEEFKTKLAISKAEDSTSPTCDPKRNYHCRFRILGKREKIINQPAAPNSYSEK